MKAPKFFITDAQIKNGIIEIDGGDARHITLVLRLKTGDAVTAACAGVDYHCAIISANGGAVKLAVLSSARADTEPAVIATLFQAPPKGDRFELIIQKCVELGVAKIIPVSTERTVVKIPANPSDARIKRYNKIAESAAKQSGRAYIPAVAGAVPLEEAADTARYMGITFAAHEKERGRRAGDYVRQSFARAGGDTTAITAAIFIGPEGGFSDNEIELLSGRGIRAVSLGGRVLRTETAAMAALIILLYETGGL